jgi:hypothetical protein
MFCVEKNIIINDVLLPPVFTSQIFLAGPVHSVLGFLMETNHADVFVNAVIIICSVNRSKVRATFLGRKQKQPYNKSTLRLPEVTQVTPVL